MKKQENFDDLKNQKMKGRVQMSRQVKNSYYSNVKHG